MITFFRHDPQMRCLPVLVLACADHPSMLDRSRHLVTSRIEISGNLVIRKQAAFGCQVQARLIDRALADAVPVNFVTYKGIALGRNGGQVQVQGIESRILAVGHGNSVLQQLPPAFLSLRRTGADRMELFFEYRPVMSSGTDVLEKQQGIGTQEVAQTVFPTKEMAVGIRGMGHGGKTAEMLVDSAAVHTAELGIGQDLECEFIRDAVHLRVEGASLTGFVIEIGGIFRVNLPVELVTMEFIAVVERQAQGSGFPVDQGHFLAVVVGKIGSRPGDVFYTQGIGSIEKGCQIPVGSGLERIFEIFRQYRPVFLPA